MAANGWIGGELYEDGQIVRFEEDIYIMASSVEWIAPVKMQITHGPVKKRGKGKVKRW